MRFRYYFYCLCLVSFVSCEQIIDTYYENRESENYVSPYKGTYFGSFSGDDNGSLKIEVSKKDNVTITRRSTINSVDDVFYDALSRSTFNGNASPTTGFRLSGNLVSQSNTYTGTWRQGQFSGNWTVQKQ